MTVVKRYDAHAARTVPEARRAVLEAGRYPPRNLAPPRLQLSGPLTVAVGEEGFEPPQLKQQVYSLPRLSSSGARPFQVFTGGDPGLQIRSEFHPGPSTVLTQSH